jgi:hypothetical protein
VKKLLFVFGLAAISAMAADWTGYIVDKKCSGNKAMLGNEACNKKCVDGGSHAVLATEDGKVYAIANQDKVKEAIGKKVTLVGKIDKDTITVEDVKM